MKLLKFLVGTAALGAAACAVAGKVQRDKQKQEELDDFLCPDIDAPVEKDLPQLSSASLAQALKSDVLSFEGCENDALPVTMIFAFENQEDAHGFIEQVSQINVSTCYDDEEKIVDVDYCGEINESELNILSDALIEALNVHNAKYVGFHFAK
jgi:hypothetical protein